MKTKTKFQTKTQKGFNLKNQQYFLDHVHLLNIHVLFVRLNMSRFHGNSQWLRQSEAIFKSTLRDSSPWLNTNFSWLAVLENVLEIVPIRWNSWELYMHSWWLLCPEILSIIGSQDLDPWCRKLPKMRHYHLRRLFSSLFSFSEFRTRECRL